MVIEMAFSVTLVAVSVLLIQSLLAVQQAPLGFDQSNVFTLQFRLPQNKYPKPENIARFFKSAIENVRAIPGVESAALVRAVPFSGNGGTVGYAIEGQPAPDPASAPQARFHLVTPDYFKTHAHSAAEGARLHRSRRPADAARRRHQRHVRQTRVAGRRPDRQAVHDAADTGSHHRDRHRRRHEALHGDRAGGAAALCRALSGAADFLVAGRADQRAGGADDVGHQRHPQGDLGGRQGSADVGRRARSTRRSPGRRGRRASWPLLLGIFAGVALLLAGVGIYGVTSYGVAQRTHEIGIRLALGASSERVLRDVVGRGVRLTLVARRGRASSPPS